MGPGEREIICNDLTNALNINVFQEMAGDVQRSALLSSLDATWDNLKRLARLELKAINPVAAVLNLLPLNWDARIIKVIIGYV